MDGMVIEKLLGEGGPGTVRCLLCGKVISPHGDADGIVDDDRRKISEGP